MIISNMASQSINKKAYIFDLDGTLFDSLGIWQEVDALFFKKRGMLMPGDYTKAITAMDLREAAAYTIERFELQEIAGDVVREWREMAAYAYGHSVRMKPHAKEYLESLHGTGAAMAVATSLTADLYEPALRAHGLLDYFSACISTSQAAYGKSKPDVYLLAAKTLGVDPHECVVFEDILIAIRSAKSAGMTVYAIYDNASSGDWEQMVIESDGVYRDFREAPMPDGKR